jgi:hypothetical protein
VGRYGATIDSLCNEALAEALIALCERAVTLQWADTRPEDNTPAVAVAEGHFVQVCSRALIRTSFGRITRDWRMVSAGGVVGPVNSQSTAGRRRSTPATAV